ncbi:MAG: methyl-accepting chemotaxis protein [Planctomycetota bacterium]
MRLTIGKKLGLGFGALIALIAVLTVVVYTQVSSVNRQADHVLNRNVQSVQHAIATQGEIHHALSMHRGYMILGLQALADERVETWGKIDGHVAGLSALESYWENPVTREAFAELQGVMAGFRAAQDKIAAIAHTDRDVPSQTKFFTEALPYAKDMEDALNAILEKERKLEATPERKLLVEYVSAAKGHLLLAKQAVTAFLVSGDEAGLQLVQDEVAACQASVDRLLTHTHLLTAAQEADFEHYIEQRKRFLAEANEVVAMRSQADWCQSEHICLNEVTPLATKADELLDRIVADQTAAQDEAGAVLQASGSSILVVTLVTSGVAAAIACAIALVLGRQITRSLNLVVARARAIAQKDLSGEDLQVKSRDEIGELATAVNAMVGSLREIIARVAGASQEVASAATQISASSDEMARGMDQQQQQTAQVSAAVEQMSASVIEVASKSSEAVQTAGQAGRSAAEGGEVVQKTVGGINEIASVVNEAAGAVKELGQRSEQIGEVIEVINDIADQTNLLALNAAIEAARAGEHGRGFAVVADEVRKLADRTTKATEEIADSIRAIQGKTGQAVARIEQGTAKVDEGVGLAQQAGGSLSAIVDGSDRVAQMIESIAAAAEEQSAAAEQIAGNVEAITTVTQQSTEGSRQAAAAANQLSAKSDELRMLVGQFRLD